jgi:hypothetical protein
LPDQGYDTQATERAAAAAIPTLVMQGISWMPHMYDDPVIFEEELRAWLRGPGRKSDPFTAQGVEQIWKYYAQWAMTGMMGPPPAQGPATQGGGGQSQPGQVMSAPGGTVNSPGHLSSTIAARANAVVKQADNTGETQARSQLSHES